MINTHTEGRVGVIEFARPKANAYTSEFMQAFNTALDELEANTSLTVVCLRSAVDGFFCAGADVSEFVASSTDANRHLTVLANRASGLMQRSEKLYVSAVNGHALGGGLEIMLATDIRLGSDADYKLGMSEVSLGLMPGNGGTQRLARTVGISKALELCVTGALFNAQEAFQIGVFNRLLAVQDFDQSVADYCKKIAAGAPLAMASIKQALYQGAGMSIEQALKLESGLADKLFDTHDASEGLNAFIEKREAIFTGR